MTGRASKRSNLPLSPRQDRDQARRQLQTGVARHGVQRARRLVERLDGLAIDVVVVFDRAQLSEIVQRVRDGGVRTNIGNVATFHDAVAAYRTERRKGKTIIHVHP